MSQREFYVDRLRSVMTTLVILHHTAITYGAIGGWFWREVEPSGSPSCTALILFCTTNQAYFMGFESRAARPDSSLKPSDIFSTTVLKCFSLVKP